LRGLLELCGLADALLDVSSVNADDGAQEG
jgi:hypothetical protein